MARYESTHYPDDEIHIKPGDRVHVPRGVLVKTTAPGEDILITKRSQTVTVHHVLPGSVGSAHPYKPGRKVAGTPPKVVWAGAGGYWKEVDINDVEKVMR